MTAEGSVTERGTGNGVEGVAVSGTRSDNDDQLFSTTTDASGAYQASFEVSDAPDEVQIEADKQKLVPESKAVSFTENLTADLELAWDSPLDEGDEDCLPLDPENVEVEEFSGGWRLVDGDNALVAFDEFEAAKDGRDIVQFYELSNFCFVNRPDPPMTYWLVEGTPPVESGDSPVDEDCVPLDPENVEVEEFSGGWRLVDGDNALVAFDERQAAENGRDIVQFYELSNFCFVNRPDPPMSYWLR